MAHVGCVTYACAVGLTSIILQAIYVGTLVIGVWAFIDSSRRRPDAFPAVGRKSKSLWVALTGVSTLIAAVAYSPIGLIGIAAIVINGVYLLDIRPRIIEITSGS
jgi:hypothetical protein